MASYRPSLSGSSSYPVPPTDPPVPVEPKLEAQEVGPNRNTPALELESDRLDSDSQRRLEHG